MLILVEATSSIDTRTEALIEKGMDRLMKGRTVFVIAHRLSKSAKAMPSSCWKTDRSSSAATTNDLLEQKGKYYQLYMGMFELS